VRLFRETASGAPVLREVGAGAPHAGTLLDTLGLVLTQLREAEADRDSWDRIALALAEACTGLRRDLETAQARLALATDTTRDAVRTTQHAVRLAEAAHAQADAARAERYFATCAACAAPIGEPQPNPMIEDGT
jgi:hypothetical protein